MFLQLQQESLLLGRRPVGFTEHYYTEWEDGLGKDKIALFLLVSISSTQVPGAEIAKEAFQLLQDHFLDDLTGDPYDRFESALREINVMVNQKEKELELKFIPNMNVLIGVIQKDMLFLSQRGEAQGYLIRKRHVSSITDGLYDEKNKEDLFQNIASGAMEVGDTTLFATGPLVQYITPNDLSKIFSEQALSQATKELQELLHGDIEEQMALLSFEVLEKTEELLTGVSPMGLKIGDEEDESERENNHGSSGKSLLHHEDEDLPSGNRLSRSLQILRNFASKKGQSGFIQAKGFFAQMRGWEKKKLLTVLAVLGVVIVGGILLLNVTLGKQRTIQAMEEKLTLAEENIAQAETQGAFDKAKANSLLDQAEDLAVEVLNSGYLGGRASQTLDHIEEQRHTLDNVHVVTEELRLVADLSDSLAGVSLLGAQPYGDRIVAYTDQNAYPVLLDEVQDADLLDANERIITGEFFAEYNTIVFLSAAAKLIEYTDGNSQFADTADVDFHSGVDLVTYSNKIYILDPPSNQIWRYQRGSAGYGSGQAYFSSDVDLGDAVSLAVDGSVWVLKEDGSILKYYGGNAVDFAIKKAPLTSMEGVSKIYTDVEISQLYILDSEENRIFVFDKSSKNDDIQYNAQYVFEDMKGHLVDLYMDKDRDVLMLMTTEALYELGF